MKKKKRVAVFASGSGSNAEALFKQFRNDDLMEIVCLMSNKKGAYVLKRAAQFQIPSLVFSAVDLRNGKVVGWLVDKQIDFVVLAGFLLKIPQNVIEQFEGRIINLHPSLLPKYGGKGMYGHHVHEAVLANYEKESGITVHLVNEAYDKGVILDQLKCAVYSDDSVETLSARIHELEHAYFGKVIKKYINHYYG